MQPSSSGGARARIRVAEREPRIRLPGQRSLRLLKWFGWTTLGAFWALIVVLIAVPLLIDWNAFKLEIAQAVRQATGRELSVGNIDVAFRPLPTVELSELRLSSPGGAALGPLVTVPEARASFRLLPLLVGELMIREFTIEKPEVDLRIDRDGNANWRLAPRPTSRDAGASSPGADGDFPFATVVLEAIDIQDGRLRFEHARLDQQIAVDDVDIEGVVDARGSTLGSFARSFEARLALTARSMTASDLLVSRLDGLRAAITVPRDPEKDPSIDANARVSFRGVDEAAEVGLSGTIGRLTALLADEAAYPFRLRAKAGEIEASLSGEIHDPLGAARPGLDLEMDAPTLAAFAPLIGVEVSDLGPFNLKLSAAFASQARLEVDTLEARLAQLALSASGEISDADTADPKPRFEVRASGRTLAALRPLLGWRTPDLGPFSIAAEVASAGQEVTIRDLAAKLGQSDLSGEAQIRLEPPRPRVTASVASKTLGLAEIRAALTKGDGTATAALRGRQLFPDDPLPFEALRLIDLDLALEVDELLVNDPVRLADTALKLGLVDGRLTIDPFATRLASGDLKGTFSVDASHQPTTLALGLDAERIMLGDVLRGLELIDLGPARADGSLDLTADGESLREIVSSLGGDTYLSGQGGQVELGPLISGLAEILQPLLGQQSDVSITCFVNRFKIQDGVMTSQAQVLSTSEFAVGGTGTIDLGEERLDLKFTTAARRPSLASFAVPFRVRGPITAPRAYPDPLGSVFTAAKVAGMFLDPIALVAALVKVDPSQEEACEAAIKQAVSGKPAEPPPGGAVGRTLEDIGRGVEDSLGE